MITFFTEALQERETTEVNSWEEAICGGGGGGGGWEEK